MHRVWLTTGYLDLICEYRTAVRCCTTYEYICICPSCISAGAASYCCYPAVAAAAVLLLAAAVRRRVPDDAIFCCDLLHLINKVMCTVPLDSTVECTASIHL